MDVPGRQLKGRVLHQRGPRNSPRNEMVFEGFSKSM